MGMVGRSQHSEHTRSTKSWANLLADASLTVELHHMMPLSHDYKNHRRVYGHLHVVQNALLAASVTSPALSVATTPGTILNLLQLRLVCEE